MDITKALNHGWPNAQWTLNGDTIDGLTWIGESPAPTLQEVQNAWEDLQENPPQPTLPTEFMVTYIGTGEPVKVVVKNGEVFVGGADETPA